MKKALAILLTLSMTIPFAPTVLADETEKEESQTPEAPFRYTVKGEMPIIPEEWEGLENGESPNEDEGIAPILVTDDIADEQENNNTALRARQITLTMGRTGTIGSTSDVDFYKFRCPASGKYRFDLINVPASKDLDYDIYLYTGSPAVEVGRSIRPDEYDSIIVDLDENELYYLKVVGLNGSYSSSDYYFITVTDDECAALGYAYPFRGTNVPKTITGGYGYYPNSTVKHYGLDLSAASGTKLYSPGKATIDHVGEDKKWGAGYTISFIMDDNAPGAVPPDEVDEYTPLDSTIVTYMHMLTDPSEIISEGERVGISTYVGQVGMTGNATGPHLHISIMNDGTWIAGDFTRTNNPLRYYTQYNFTGPEDREEYNSAPGGSASVAGEFNEETEEMKRMRSIWEFTEYDDYMYFIPGVLIQSIGEKYLEWSNLPYETANEKSIFSCLDYFNISNEEFIEILETNPHTREKFTDEMLQEIFTARTQK